MQKIGRVTGQKVTCEQNLTSRPACYVCPVKGYNVYVFSKGWLITHANGSYSAVSAARFDELYRDPVVQLTNCIVDSVGNVSLNKGDALNRSDIMELANVFSISGV